MKLERNPVSKHRIQPEPMEMERLTRNGTAEPVSRDQILRHECGQVNIYFPWSADHEQDRQSCPVDPYSCCNICVTMHACILYEQTGRVLFAVNFTKNDLLFGWVLHTDL